MDLQATIPDNPFEMIKRDGYLLLSVSENAERIISDTFSAALDFFRSPLSEKERCILPGDSGYRPFGQEYSRTPAAPDQIESFSVSVRLASSKNLLSFAPATHLYEKMLDTINFLEPITEAVTKTIARHFGYEQLGDNATNIFRYWSLLQINYSRPNTVSKSLINDVHEDGCLITITVSNAPGLEIQTGPDNFVPLDIQTNKIIVMPGDIAWLLSGGTLQPLYHRVRPDVSCDERVSLQFFGDIDPRFCQPWVRNAVNQDIDIGLRVLKNPSRFGLTEWALES